MTLSLIPFCEWAALYARAGQGPPLLPESSKPCCGRTSEIQDTEREVGSLRGGPRAEGTTVAPLPRSLGAFSKTSVQSHPRSWFWSPTSFFLLPEGKKKSLHFYDFITLSLEMFETAFHPQVALCGYEPYLIPAPSI